MIELEKLSIGYGGPALVADVDVAIPKGRLVAMVGCNGSGKSTLIRTMAGLCRPLSGRVLYDGHDILSLDAAARSRQIALVNTERVRIPGLTCSGLVALGRSPYTGWTGRLSGKDQEAVDNAIAIVGMDGFADRTMDLMSDGECQKIMVARALAQDTPVILLDEPTAFLDYPGRRMVASLLSDVAHYGEGRTIVYSTHDIDLAIEYSDDILLVAPPHIYYGPASESSVRIRMYNAFGVPQKA